MNIAVPRETALEGRVALTPQMVLRLVERRHVVSVEPGAGSRSGFADEDYRSAGAAVTPDAVDQAELVVVVGPPPFGLVERLREGATLLGFLDPFGPTELVRSMSDRKITSFAMEAIPRSTLAQSMDALSSQATAAGYAAVIAAAGASPRIFPMLTTAAGTVPPVKVLVLGAGVAGLHAIANSRRLGAVVSAYDIRPEVKEQIESLGARFIPAPVDELAATTSGYAKEVSDETQRRQMDALAPHVADADVVITTAQVPGQPAPLLISREMVESMRRGAVIVDVAAPGGGNCELTRPGETVEHDGVTILGPTDLPSRVSVDASQMYARNVTQMIERLSAEDGSLRPDFGDPIVSEACIVRQGAVVHPVVRRLLGLEARS